MPMLSQLFGQPQGHDASFADLLRRLQSPPAQMGGIPNVQPTDTTGSAQNYQTAARGAAAGQQTHPMLARLFSIGGAR